MEKWFDARSFYIVLDAERESKGMSWRQVAKECGVAPSTFTRISQGKLPDGGNLLSILYWLQMDVHAFFNLENQSQLEHLGTLATISLALQKDPYLSPESKSIIDGLVRSAYGKMCGGRNRQDDRREAQPYP